MDLETDITVDDEAAGCIWLVTGKIAGEGTSVCWKTTKKTPEEVLSVHMRQLDTLELSVTVCKSLDDQRLI